jgi:uncharacterized membrane protein
VTDDLKFWLARAMGNIAFGLAFIALSPLVMLATICWVVTRCVVHLVNWIELWTVYRGDKTDQARERWRDT